jgi:hypothetical protein
MVPDGLVQAGPGFFREAVLRQGAATSRCDGGALGRGRGNDLKGHREEPMARGGSPEGVKVLPMGWADDRRR